MRKLKIVAEIGSTTTNEDLANTLEDFVCVLRGYECGLDGRKLVGKMPLRGSPMMRWKIANFKTKETKS